ncbi:MAG: rRNA maturation RNase YbeY [Phycisphaeraceae bacterium]|nr:rRNA maturation RNase YbeY [Phycisphaeraceae bacterium]
MPPAEPTTQDEPDTPGPDEPPSIRIDLVCQTDISGIQIDGWLDQQVRRAIGFCGITAAQLNLVIVADDEMAQLHEQYTGVAGTTDVLTFDLKDSAEGGSPPVSNALASDQGDPTPIESDIILCLDEAKRQASQRGHEPRQELLLYAIHGLMHLLGEDDHDEAAYQRMHAREDALLKQMGFSPLFDPDRVDDPGP